MIRNIGYITYGPFHDGGWRYSAGQIEVSCDAPNCKATVTPSGLEHNGPSIENIYLQPTAGNWRIGRRDLCPEHNTPEPEEEQE